MSNKPFYSLEIEGHDVFETFFNSLTGELEPLKDLFSIEYDDYDELAKLQKQCNAIGYAIDYYLDCSITAIYPIDGELKYLNDGQLSYTGNEAVIYMIAGLVTYHKCGTCVANDGNITISFPQDTTYWGKYISEQTSQKFN